MAQLTEAMFNLGVILQSGDGVPADKEKAFSYYTQAAQAGLTRAMNNLGYMLRVGDGVEEDKDAALQWYLKAAKAGDMDGQYHLGDAQLFALLGCGPFFLKFCRLLAQGSGSQAGPWLLPRRCTMKVRE